MNHVRLLSAAACLTAAASLAAQSDATDYHSHLIGAVYGVWHESPPIVTDVTLTVTRHSVSNGYGLCGVADGGGFILGGGMAHVWSQAFDVCVGGGALGAASAGAAKERICYSDAFDYTPNPPPSSDMDIQEWNPIGVASSSGDMGADASGSLTSGTATTIARVKWLVNIQPLTPGGVSAEAKCSGSNTSSSGTSVSIGGVTFAIPYVSGGSLIPDSASAGLLRNPMDTNHVSREVTGGITGYSFADGGWFGAAQCDSNGDGTCNSTVYLTDRNQ